MTKGTPQDLDARLLALLKADARLPTAVLARRLGVARSTVQDHLRRLERTGTIRGYTVQLAPAAEARHVRAHVMIAVDPARQASVERKLKAVAAVTSLYTVSGSYDLIAVVAADSTEALDAALDEVRETPGVKETVTSVVLSQRFQR